MGKAAVIATVVVGLGLVGLGGYLLGDGGSDESDDSAEQSLLVVKGQASLHGTMLEINSPQVEWFSDRPDRDSGRYVAHTVVDNWDHWGFGDDPPNAAFSGLETVVELTDPALIGDGALGFELVPVEGELPSGDLGEQALFIDAAPTYVNDQITDGDPGTNEAHCEATLQASRDLVLTQADPEAGSSRYAPQGLSLNIDAGTSGVIDLEFGNSYHADVIYRRGSDGSFVHVHPHCGRKGIISQDTSCTIIAPNGDQSPCPGVTGEAGGNKTVTYSV